MSLYFFDPTAQILVPEPVFVPDGRHSSPPRWSVACSTTRPSDPRMTRTFVPPGLHLRGVGADHRRPASPRSRSWATRPTVDEEARQRILTQLIWTMRQEPRIRAVRLTIGDEEQGLPGAATQVNLDVGDAFDPTGAQSSGDLFGARRRARRPRLDRLLPAPRPAPWASTGSACARSASTSPAIASPASRATAGACWSHRSTARAAPSRSPAARRDLLPPAWDFADRIWLADRAAGGAVISVVVGEQPPRQIEVPGVSGRDVRHLLDLARRQPTRRRRPHAEG